MKKWLLLIMALSVILAFGTFAAGCGAKVLNELDVSVAEEIELTEGDALTLKDLVGVKVTAKFSKGDPEVYELDKLSELPDGMTIDKLGQRLEKGTVPVTVSYTYGGATKTAVFNITVAEAQKLPEGTLILTSVPQGTLTVSAVVRQEKATANVTFEYGPQSFIVTAFVTDENVFTGGASVYANDGIEIQIDKVVRQKGYTENTVSVVADAKGGIIVKNLFTDEIISGSGISGTSVLFSLDGKKVAGYKITVNIPYEECAVTAGSFDAAVCFGLNNAYNSGISQFVYSNAYNENYENVYTFAHVKQDGTLEENVYINYGVVWGDGGTHKASSVWNLDGDDGETNVIYMTGNDYSDNYVYMSKSNKLEFYAEVKLKVTEFMKDGGGNWDGYPKFGIIVKNAAGTNGFIYYVDAVSSSGVINANSTNLGYNTLHAGGWHGNWATIGSLGESSNLYTENYLTLGIYRSGGVFVLYCNGNEVRKMSTSLSSTEEAYVGLFSFNLKLEAKDYRLITDPEGLAPYVIEQQSVDYLFIGDSYIDTAFWYNYGNAFDGYSAANIGVGGTKIGYWNDLAEAVTAQYQAEHIVIHIGVNDIDDGNVSGSTAYSNLVTMLEKYHNLFPEATIHYVTIEHNMLFQNKWGEYDVLNAAVKNLSYDWLKIVDMAAYITADESGSTQHWFNSDGLHYGIDGYALFTQKVMESLGIALPEVLGSTGFGNVAVEGAPEFAYSPGWVLEDGVAHNVGQSFNRIGAESQVFINGLYDSDFYAEVKISLGDCYCPTDKWAKTGIAVRAETGTYFYYINSSTETNPGRTPEGHIIYTDNYGNVFYRPENIGRNWQSELFSYFYLGSQSFDHYTDNSFTTLAVAKLGSKLVFIANGNVVATLNESLLGETQKAAVSVFTFNMDVYTKDARFVVGRENVEYELAPSYSVTCAEVDGATLSTNVSVAKAGDTVIVDVNMNEGYILVSVTVNGESITQNAQGIYTFTMPAENVVVSATFAGRFTVDMTDESVAGKLIASSTSPTDGETVTFTAAEGWIINTIYANGMQIEPVGGVYELVVTENVAITGEMLFTADGLILDGEFDGTAYGQDFGIKAESGRGVKVYSVKGENGVWIYVLARTATNVTSAPEWYNNHNFEFKLNDGAQSYVSASGRASGVTYYKYNAIQLSGGDYDGMFEHIIEIFVHKDNIGGWTDDGNVKLSYAFKAIGEAVRFEGMSNNQWPQDNYWQSAIGGYNNRLMTYGSGTESHPDNLFITDSGLMTTLKANNAVLDGDLSEFAGKTSVTVGNSNALFEITGFTADDGIYLGFTIWQVNIAAPTAEWYLNDNIEIKYGDYNLGFSIYDGFIAAMYTCQGATVRTALTSGDKYDEGYRYMTVVEYFIPDITDEVLLKFGCNGNGFGGWQSLIWDNSSVLVSQTGVSSDYLNFDGELNESIWTTEVLANKFTQTVNGAEVSVVGVKTCYGIALGITVNHNVETGAAIQGDGSAWWNYLGPELRIAGMQTQFAASVFNTTAIGYIRFGVATVDNGEEAEFRYTTTFEITCSCAEIQAQGEQVSLQIGGVYETGFAWLYNGSAVSFYVTSNGLVQAY